MGTRQGNNDRKNHKGRRQVRAHLPKEKRAVQRRKVGVGKGNVTDQMSRRMTRKRGGKCRKKGPEKG